MLRAKTTLLCYGLILLLTGCLASAPAPKIIIDDHVIVCPQLPPDNTVYQKSEELAPDLIIDPLEEMYKAQGRELSCAMVMDEFYKRYEECVEKYSNYNSDLISDIKPE